MRLLRLASSLLAYFDELVYLESTLLARPETAHLAGQITELLDHWAVIFGIELETRRKTAQVNARVAMADLTIDLVLRAFYNATLGEAGLDRNSQLFRGLFGGTLASFISAGLQKQVQIAQGVIDRANSLAIVPQSLRDKFGATLQAAVVAGKDRLQERNTQAVARVNQRFDVESYKQQVNAARQAVYGALVEIGSRGGNGKDFADKFFPAADDAEQESPAPAAPNTEPK